MMANVCWNLDVSSDFPFRGIEVNLISFLTVWSSAHPLKQANSFPTAGLNGPMSWYLGTGRQKIISSDFICFYKLQKCTGSFLEVLCQEVGNQLWQVKRLKFNGSVERVEWTKSPKCLHAMPKSLNRSKLKSIHKTAQNGL